jgi:hypothetical protein
MKNRSEGRVMLAVKGEKMRENSASTTFPSKVSLPFCGFKHFSDLHPKLAKFWTSQAHPLESWSGKD